jgi:hypothetical protein
MPGLRVGVETTRLLLNCDAEPDKPIHSLFRLGRLSPTVIKTILHACCRCITYHVLLWEELKTKMRAPNHAYVDPLSLNEALAFIVRGSSGSKKTQDLSLG